MFLKFKSKTSINSIDITNQCSDKFILSPSYSSLNFNDNFTKKQFDNIMEHGFLKSNFILKYKELTSGIIKDLNFTTLNTFTSKSFTGPYENTFLGSQLKNKNLNQFINLNKNIYIENPEIIIALNNNHYTEFYPKYLKDKAVGDHINNKLIEQAFKYQECFNLINIKYQEGCFQAVRLIYSNNYFFEIITIV
jgi:hypothetical protein